MRPGLSFAPSLPISPTSFISFLSFSRELSAHTLFLSPVDFLREDTLVGTSFLRVAAHDDDFGTNAAITYSMSLEQPEYLQVNPVTGWVYVNQPISQVGQQLLAGSQSSSVHTHTYAHTDTESASRGGSWVCVNKVNECVTS